MSTGFEVQNQDAEIKSHDISLGIQIRTCILPTPLRFNDGNTISCFIWPLHIKVLKEALNYSYYYMELEPYIPLGIGNF